MKTTNVGPKTQNKAPKNQAPKKMSQAELQREQEREQKMKENAAKPKEAPKIAKIVPVKKAVASTQDIKNKVAAEKRKKEEEERLKREEEERLAQEAEMQELLELERLEQKEMKKQQKEQKKRDKLGVAAIMDGNAEDKDAQIDELLFLLTAEQNEKRAAEKKERDRLKQIAQQQKEAEEEQKQKEKENSWGGEDDDDLDVFGDDGAVKTAKDKKEDKDKKEKDKKKSSKDMVDGESLRSPIICVLGHVDTGKTSILDKIRSSTVQQREEGGITQQIGASFISQQFIKDKTTSFPHKLKFEVPGLLIVDTPGHESFSNLRSRGSSLADLTILVVDIMHGLEPQTIESINILKARKAPFIVALNKVDRLYNWKAVADRDSKASIETQSSGTQNDFDLKYNQVKNQLGEQGFFTDFWWKVSDINQVVPIVPTSAVTGEGLCDLLAILIQFSQQLMRDRLTYSDETQCTVLEVKKTEGFGYTLDCILVNGYLKRNQKIVIAGQKGPIVTTIRNILTPKEAKEMREISAYDYERHEIVQAAIGCKLAGEGFEDAVAGSTVYVCEDEDSEEEEMLKDAVMDELKQGIVKANSDIGVAVHGNSLGALEALVGYLRSENTKVQRDPVNVSLIQIGPITKQTIQEIALQAEKGHPETAVVLAFDVNIDKEIYEKAKEAKVTIITAKIIYHLYDEYALFIKNWHESERERLKEDIVIPCIMKPIAIFHTKSPVLIGVKIVKGSLQLRQRVALVNGKQGGYFLGTIAGIESNKVSQKEAKAGEEVAIRIDTTTQYTVGKDGIFDVGAVLATQMTRKSIDILKTHFREELKEWLQVVKDIKDFLKIQ
ncbi:Translation_initiation factor IF-2 [Hexamita inflata]|uniref:Eukaryotic translation initiation factor 5B n=1 Tax=Hexamita inflata TaxID=28002 RepID=A0ABP1J546_9EUKA